MKNTVILAGREYVSQKVLMDELGITLMTLRHWRETGVVPEPIKLGQRNYYDRARVHEQLVAAPPRSGGLSEAK
jgi:predicted site-specific integrase-resolvase